MFYGKSWDRLPTASKIRQVRQELEKDISRWNDIRENGCSDPFWSDGVNLNLVRNHIIHDLRLLSELDQKPVQISMFMLLDSAGTVPDDVMNDERIPPLVPDTFMAHDRPCNYFRNSVASCGKQVYTGFRGCNGWQQKQKNELSESMMRQTQGSII